MSQITNILHYISPNTSFVVNLDDYRRFIEIAKLEEQERIIKLWDEEMSCDCENPMPHLLERIKGEQ